MRTEAQIVYDASPAELDRLLARGWFRSGAIVFRAPLLILGDDVHELVQIRLPLDAPLPKNRRRRLRRNRERFRCEVGPAYIDDAAQALYEVSRARFIDFIARDLHELVIGELAGVFDTREIRVFDGDRLVALSFFDVGHRAVTGVLGLHDPAYARYGLGIYTMMEEVEFARTRGARWYYPGYVVPGLESFDYKLSLGPVQVMDRGGRWRPKRQPRGSGRAEHARRRMAELVEALSPLAVPTIPRRYPAFWAGRLLDADRRYLEAMWHVAVGDDLVVEYLADMDRFRVARVEHADELDPFEGFVEDPALAEGCEKRLLYYGETLFESDQLHAAAVIARRRLRS